MRPLAALALLVAFLAAAPAGQAAAGAPLPDRMELRYEQCPYDPDVLECVDLEPAVVYLTEGSRFERWHAIGHLFDYQVLTDSGRAWLTTRLGFPAGTEWMPQPRSPEASPPGEVFADAYAMCAMRRSPAGRVTRRGAIVLEWQSEYGYYPTVRRHRRLCTAIAVYGLVRGYR